MKITKQRLKEIIKEELENLQNEGFFSRVGAALGLSNKVHKQLHPKITRQLTDLRDKVGSAGSAKELASTIDALFDLRDMRREKMIDATGANAEGNANKELNDDQLKEWRFWYKMWSELIDSSLKKLDQMEQSEQYKAELMKRAEEERQKQEADRRAMLDKSQKDYQSSLDPRNNPKKSKRPGPNVGMGLAYGDARSEKERYGESKITKSAFKAIIAEELKNSQNEGFFSRVGASLGRKNKMHGFAFPQFKKVFDKFKSADDKDAEALLQAAQQIIKARQNYVKTMKKDAGVDGGEWSQELNSDQFKEYQDLFNNSIRYTGRMLNQASELDRRAKLRKEIEAAKEAQRIELEQAKAERAEARAEAERNRKDKKDPKDARPNFAIGQQDRKAKTSGFGANESKITKSALKAIIAEELEEIIKEQRVYIDDAKVGDYMEIMVDDDGRVDGDALPPDDKRIKAQSPGSVDQYIPFKALVQVVAVSKYGEE